MTGRMDRYRLHYAPDNASLIIRLALEHRGLPYETRLVDRAIAEQSSLAFRTLNPHGLIPVLETPHGPLFETGAILLWLADTHGGLAPAPDAADRGGFLKWLFFVANTVHPALRMMFYPEKYVGADPADHAVLRNGLSRLLRIHLGQLDTLGETRPPWFAAANPSVLDFYLVCCLRWCALYPSGYDRSWFSLADTPRLEDMCRHLQTLPCCHAAQAAEGLGDAPFTAPLPPDPPEGSAT